MADIRALNLIYADEFGVKNHAFFRTHIDISVGSWMNDLRNLVDAKFLNELALVLTNEEKPVIVARFLTQQNNIKKYKRFISIWNTHDPTRGNQFETNLRNRIHNQGLTDVDNRFSNGSQGKAMNVEAFCIELLKY